MYNISINVIDYKYLLIHSLDYILISIQQFKSIFEQIRLPTSKNSY